MKLKFIKLLIKLVLLNYKLKIVNVSFFKYYKLFNFIKTNIVLGYYKKNNLILSQNNFIFKNNLISYFKYTNFFYTNILNYIFYKNYLNTFIKIIFYLKSQQYNFYIFNNVFNFNSFYNIGIKKNNLQNILLKYLYLTDKIVIYNFNNTLNLQKYRHILVISNNFNDNYFNKYLINLLLN